MREHREQSTTQTTQPLQLFVSDVSYDANWRDLKHHFSQCGDVKRSEVMEVPNGRNHGYGDVRFCRSRNSQSAISHSNIGDFMGMRL